MAKQEVWIIDALRTPVGRHEGGLSGVRPDDFAAHVLEALSAIAGIPAGDIEDVYLGCVNQAGEGNRNAARMSLLLAGTVTAGNLSMISDGAATLLLVLKDYALTHGLQHSELTRSDPFG